MYELAKIFELKNIHTTTPIGKLHDRLMKQEEIRQTWNGTWKSWYASTNGTETNVQCSDGSDSKRLLNQRENRIAGVTRKKIMIQK